MRKSFLVASVATLALGTAGIAYAQDTTPSIEATGSGSPSKAGTKSKPAAVNFKLDVKNNAAGEDHGEVDQDHVPEDHQGLDQGP